MSHSVAPEGTGPSISADFPSSSKTRFFALALGSIGVVYGDIGTSPLYAFRDSALDHFVHEITRVGMIEVWRGIRIATPAYLKFSVSLNVTTLLIGQVGADVHLETEIRTRHGYSSFQQPEDIADAIRLFSTVELWKEVGALLGEDPQELKAQLKLIVARRNKIAHEADIDPSYPGQRWPIGRQDAEDALSFVEKVGEAIFKLVA
jgi:hypothetical protein